MAVNLRASRITAKDFTPNAETTIAKQDPLEIISLRMSERGFDSLWTAQPLNTRTTVRFTDEVKRNFLRMYAVTGRIAYSAVSVGVSTNSIDHQRDSDPVFTQAMKEAALYFSDILHAEMYRRGVEGYDQEVLGGRNRDEIIKIKTYSDRMLELLARKHMPALGKGDGENEVPEQTTIINNQFNFNNLSADDLATAKKLLENQEVPVDGKVVDDS